MAGAGEVRVAVLTPAGRGAIATIAVFGAGAATLLTSHVQRRSRGRLEDVEVGRLVVAEWSASGEEIVVARVGPDHFELNCHGGAAAVDSIVNVLVPLECQSIDWRQWIDETSADRISAEALHWLAAAPTTRTAAILWDQARGALARSCDDVVGLVDAGEFGEAAKRLEILLARAEIGLHLVQPWRVVFAGLPNVGKSSLLNALLGYERVVVFDQPGTTRDVVTARTAIDGWPVELTDTAGLGCESDELDMAAAQAARRTQAEADLVVLVLDPSRPQTHYDDALCTQWPDALIVHSKCDLHAVRSAASPGALKTSAVTNLGIAELMTRICECLVPSPPQPGDAIPFTERHVSALRGALEALSQGETGKARLLVAGLARPPDRPRR